MIILLKYRHYIKCNLSYLIELEKLKTFELVVIWVIKVVTKFGVPLDSLNRSMDSKVLQVW